MHEGSIGIENFSQITPIHYLLEIGTAARLGLRTWHPMPRNRAPTISRFCFELTIVEYAKATAPTIPTKPLTEQSHSCRLGLPASARRFERKRPQRGC